MREKTVRYQNAAERATLGVLPRVVLYVIGRTPNGVAGSCHVRNNAVGRLVRQQ